MLSLYGYNKLDNAFDTLSSYFPKDIREEFLKNAYIAGGSIFCLATNKPVKDYDFFIEDLDLLERLKKLDVWKCVTEYALSLGMFQVVTKFSGSPYKVVGEFDFKHNMFYKFYKDHKIYNALPLSDMGKEAIILRSNKILFNSNRARDIEGVYLRIEKFLKKGMTISTKERNLILSRVTRKSIKEYKIKHNINKRNKFSKTYL